MNELRKACSHGRFDSHFIEAGLEYENAGAFCAGGMTPNHEDLIAALEADGWVVPPLQVKYTT